MEEVKVEGGVARKGRKADGDGIQLEEEEEGVRGHLHEIKEYDYTNMTNQEL